MIFASKLYNDITFVNYNITTMNKITLFLAFLMSLGALNAQSLEDELGFLYVKADYLLETDRYEDAIQEFTKIIDKDPTFKDVLFKRAKAKYAIAAFLGTKRDLLKAFELVGIAPETIVLYGKALKNLDEDAAATITQNTASMLSGNNENNTKTGKKKRNKNQDTNNDNQETDYSEDNRTSGDVIKDEAQKIDDKVGTILDEILGKEDSTTDNNDYDGSNDSSSGGVDIVESEPEYVPDMSVNELIIDEDVTIIIQDGLGGRKILKQPNIVLLNEISGNISIDVCVNENGKVTNAEFNKDASSLSAQSVVSVAVRKSKEFWFENSNQEEICGTFNFKILGKS